MPTDRSDNLYASWRESTEKFDYFILGVICAMCAFISQTYKPAQVGMNAGTLELIALLVLVLASVVGFRRIERVLLVTMLNHRELHAYEARGAMVAKMSGGKTLINEATGPIYTPEAAAKRVSELTKTIEQLTVERVPVQAAALRSYKLRNAFTLIGFLLLLTARVLSAYPSA